MSLRRRSPPTLSHAAARAFYDRFVSLQEWQAFYENAALQVLARDGAFAGARAVLELGCGTGRFAERLLAGGLPPDAHYVGLDVSTRMVDRTRRRLARFGPRAEVRRTDGALRLAVRSASCDRFIAAYVLDLLSDADTRVALDEAHRVLVPHGRLCIASLSAGTSRLSRAVARLWGAIHRIAPILVGGCRPVDVGPFLAPGRWDISTSETVVAFGVPTQAIIAIARAQSR